MHRRRLVAGAGLGLASALAGCLGSGRETLDERPPENAVEDAVRTAVGEANTAAVALATAREDVESPEDLDVDRAALEARVATARSALEDAEGSEAAGEYEAELAAARSYVDVVDGLLTGTVDLADAAARLEDLESALQSQAFDRAAEELSAVRPAIEDARTTTEDAASTAESLDADRLEAYGAQIDRVADGLEEVTGLAAGADALTAGYEDVLAGREHLAAGETASGDGDYGAAASEFEDAGTRFADATATFEDEQATTDDRLATEFETALCRSSHLEDAAGHFAAAAQAAQDRDPITADGERRAGEDAVDAAARCGG